MRLVTQLFGDGKQSVNDSRSNPREASRAIHLDQVADVRQAVGSLRVPTLVMHREGYMRLPLEESRRMTQQIPGARFVVLPGNDAALYTEPMAEGLHHIEEFLKGLQEPIDADRALAAILFTDIVGSTEKATALGDREWRNLLETHDAVARTVVEQHRGSLVKMTGDGVLATFEGPGRAIRCAVALSDALRPLGLQIRVGLHTGEIEVRDTDIAGTVSTSPRESLSLLHRARCWSLPLSQCSWRDPASSSRIRASIS